LLALSVVGCHLCSHGDVKPTRPPAAIGTAPIQSGVIPLSPGNARIAFTGSTAITSQSGHFEAFDGTLEVPSDDPKDMKIHVAVNMDSTTTKIGLLTNHLKAEDFFDVARYPKSEFVLDNIRPSGDAGRYQVSGNLTLHGVQQPVEFPARITVTPEEVSFEATMTVRQTEFGMTEAAKKTKDEVPVTISIHGHRK
jgi:polyisoprenoid-binding protein YceI